MSSRTARRMLTGAVLGLGLLAPLACGNEEPPVSDVATAELRPRTDEIRLLATAGRTDEALARVGDLRAVVADLQARGEITEAGAAEILERAEALATQLALVTTTTTTTTAPPTTQPPPPPEEDRGDRDEERDEERDEGGGNGNGNGNGNDRDD